MENQEFDNCGNASSVELFESDDVSSVELFWVFESDDVGILHLSSRVRRRWLRAVSDKKVPDNDFKQLHLGTNTQHKDTEIEIEIETQTQIQKY